MRKDQVDTAGVDVERFAQILHRHRGALYVPARPSRADLALPKYFAFFGRLPQNEISRVGLVVLIDVNARAGADAGEIVVGELAIFRKLRNAVINRALTLVSAPALAQLLDG